MINIYPDLVNRFSYTLLKFYLNINFKLLNNNNTTSSILIGKFIKLSLLQKFFNIFYLKPFLFLLKKNVSPQVKIIKLQLQKKNIFSLENHEPMPPYIGR